MRVARVLTRLNLGGPGRQVLASDPQLARRGHARLVLAVDLIGQAVSVEVDASDVKAC